MTSSLRRRLLQGALIWSLGGALAAACLALALLRSHLDRAGEPPLHPQINAATLSALGAGSILLLVGGGLTVVAALRPLRALGTALSRFRGGGSAQVEGRYPTEIQPLVDDLNRLLRENAAIVERARTQAGNLAHALKTPLAVLTNEALAEPVQAQVEAMRRTVSFHLARARAAVPARAGERCDVALAAERVLRTMSVVHRERNLDLSTSAAPQAGFHGTCRDLEEMIGNLLDNACKWARARVSVASRLEQGAVVVEVEDDGPGMDEAAMARAFAWGERLDETRAGEGLGLAIVRELAEGYGGEATLSRSGLGGLKATLRLPAQAAGGS